jgi:hypothetical protein
MNDNLDSTPAQQLSAFLPLILLGVSILLLNLFQLSVMLPQRTQIQRNITQNEQGVAQSRQAQGNLQRLIEDLVSVSNNNKDAQAIIAKYNISIAPPAGQQQATPPAAIK